MAKKKKMMIMPVPIAGGSKFTDFFTKTIPRAATTVYEKALKPAGKFIKDQKILSKGLALIPHPGAQVASKVAGVVGLGKGGKKGGKKGKGFADIGKQFVNEMKKQKVISKGAELINHPKAKTIAKIAHMTGYGPKIMVPVKKGKMSGGARSSLNGRLFLV